MSWVFVVNAAPGVGKTTLLKSIHQNFKYDLALLDGDDVGRIIPFELSLNWLDLMQYNMIACAKNFRSYGKENIVLSFVFPSKKRLNRLKVGLEKEGFKVLHITLFCDEQEVERRVKQRNTSRIIDVNRAMEINKEIKELDADFSIDTTLLGSEEVSKVVCDFIVSKILG